jgi:hypothetical protein
MSAENPVTPEAESDLNSVEALRRKRVELEARVAEAKRKKEEDIANQLKDREAVIAEDERLVPLMEEAEGTLEYFETQQAQGLLTNEKDLGELEGLKTLVASLEQQREDLHKKYDALMANPEIYGKVWDEAHAVDKQKMTEAEAARSKVEFQERCETTAKELMEKAAVIKEHLKTYAIERQEDLAAWQMRPYVETKRKLEEIVNQAIRPIQEGREELEKELSLGRENLYEDDTRDLSAYISEIENYRGGLGWRDGKKKAAVDYILRHRAEFEVASAQQAANKELKMKVRLPARDHEVGKEYLGFMDEVLEKTNGLFGNDDKNSERNGFYWRVHGALDSYNDKEVGRAIEVISSSKRDKERGRY